MTEGVHAVGDIHHVPSLMGGLYPYGVGPSRVLAQGDDLHPALPHGVSMRVMGVKLHSVGMKCPQRVMNHHLFDQHPPGRT